MPWGRWLPAFAMVVAGAICVPAEAQVVDQPGGDVQWVRRVPPAPSVPGANIFGGASADAVYSNLRTFRNQSFAAGGATQQVLNTITRLAADDLNLVGTPPYSVNGFRFTVTNLNPVDVSARMLVRFYLPNGPGGGPGTLIEARTYNPIVFTAGVVGTIKTSSQFVLRSSRIWAGITFDNNGGATGATAAQLDNLAQGNFSPADLGTSTDQYFVTTGAGSFDSSNPAGTLANFGGAPPADFGWEILTAQDVDLSITNTDGVATAFPGGSVVYTITASNAGPDTVFDARVVDAFPASLTCGWTCAGSAGNTCAASGIGNINDATVALAVGGSVTYTATCAVSAAATGTLVNTATIFAPGTAVEASIANNSATDSDAIGISADLAITNTDGVTSATSGGSVTYTITASNAGPNNATGATVADPFPASLTCTWTCLGAGGGTCTAAGSGNLNDTVNLPVGGTVTYTANCTIAAAATGTLSNTATVAVPTGAIDPAPGNNSATDVTTVIPGADLLITKSHTGNFTQGQTGTYTLTVSNTGGSPTSGSVTIIDDVPVGLVPTSAAGAGWTCSIAAQGGAICNRSDPLAAGASYPPITLTVSVAVNAPASVTNTAIVFGGGETNPSNNTATDPTTITAGPDLTIAKSHTGNFTQGQPGTYSLTISNVGGSPTSGSVTVTDNVPIGLVPTSAAGAGWTCNVAAQGAICNRGDPLAPGASFPPITLTVAVASNAPASVTNTALVFGGGETNPSNNTATDPTTITAGPDLAIAKSHTGNFTQGQPGTYSLTISNAGGSPTGGSVTVTDNVPIGLVPTSAAGAGWTCNVAAQGVTCSRSDPLAPGQGYPAITLAVSVAPNAPASVTNTATVSAGGDVNSNNNSASDPTTIIAVADLTLTKTHAGSFLQGQVGATYTLIVSNIGGGPSSGPVTVNDTVPAGLTPTAAAGAGWACNIAGQAVSCTRADALNVGASYPAITLTVNVAPAAPSSLTNTAQVAGGGETNTANNTASDITTIGPGVDLTISKSHSGNFTQGQTGATYTITVSNPSSSPTTGVVTVTDNVPAGLVPTSAAGTGWICSIAGQDVTCTRSDPLATGQSYPSIALTVNVPGAPGSVTNAVTVSGGGDVNQANNSATDVTTIIPGADLTMTKSHTGNFTQGQTGATYAVTVTNSGVGPTTAMVTVTDTLPVGLSSTAATGAGWSCSTGALAVVCGRSDPLAAGASYPPITLTVSVAVNAPASVTNTAIVFGGGETNPSNNTATDPTTITAGPDLTIAKSHTGNFTQGQPGTYSLTISNVGGSPTSGSVTVTDNVPIGLVPTSAAGAGWTCNVAAQGAICNRGDPLALGASFPPITLTVAVASNAPASVTNTALVFGGGETNPSNNTATDPTTITAGPDLAIAKSHTGNFTQGQPGTYSLTISNAGGSPTGGSVTVTDNVPIGLVPTSAAGAGWTCNVAAQGVTCSRSDPLAPGQGYPAITLAVSVAPNAPASVTNTATVSAGGDVNSNNNSASDPTTIIAVADLTLTKTHAGSFLQGQVGATYTLIVSNIGGGPSSGPVTVNDTVPAGLTPTAAAGAGWVCNIAGQAVSCTRADALNVGASYPAITLTVNVAPAAPSSLTNTAQVAGGGETNTANNTASDITTIGPGVDLTISKSHSGNFTQGQTGATYAVTVTNAGVGSTSGSVTVTDNVPIGLVPTSAAGAGWTCGIAAQAAICNRSDPLAPGQSYPAIALAVSVQPDAPASVTNTAVVSAGGDVNSNNNSASDPTTIIAVADLTITKSHTGNFTQGQTGATYTITVSNTGGAATTGSVTVTDTVPSGLNATNLSGAGWNCTVATTACTRSDALNAGASYPPITITVDIALNAPLSVTNTAQVAGGGDVDAGNNTASDPTLIAAPMVATQVPTLWAPVLVVLLLLIAAIGAASLRARRI